MAFCCRIRIKEREGTWPLACAFLKDLTVLGRVSLFLDWSRVRLISSFRTTELLHWERVRGFEGL